MILPVFLYGVIGMIAQAVFLREIVATFRGGELTVGAALFFWLLWTSAGSAAAGRILQCLHDPRNLFHRLIPWYGFLGYAGYVLVGAIPFIASLAPGEHIPYDIQFLAVALAFAPFNLLGGFLFPLAVISMRDSGGRSTGKTYTLEALGAAAAGVIISLVLAPVFPNRVIALIGPSTGIACGILCMMKQGKGYYGSSVNLIAALALTTFGAFLYDGASAHRYRGQTLLGETDTRYGRIRVTSHGEQVTFYSDAATLFSHPDAQTSEHTAHIPLLAADRLTGVLVLGGSAGGTVEEILKYPTVERITCVELDPELFALAERHIGESWHDNPRVTKVADDARAYLTETFDTFDVIVMNMPPPLSGSVNRFYTTGFFRIAAGRLSDTGILSFALPGAENYIPDDLAVFLAGIRASLAEVFPSVAVLPGAEVRFIASKNPGAAESLTWETLENRRIDRGISTLYVRDYYLSDIFSSFRVEMAKQALDSTYEPRLNTDFHPEGYFRMTLSQGGIEGSTLTSWAKRLASPRLMYMLLAAGACIMTLTMAFPGHGAPRRTALAAIVSVGMTEISLEVLAIMAYQTVFGLLYGRIALLTGAYMAGLAAGAFLSTKRVTGSNNAWKPLAFTQGGIACIAVLWCIVLTVGAQPGTAGVIVESAFYLLTAAAGIAGGFQFPVADSLYRQASGQKRTNTGAIYAADLAGSSVGAFLTASLMIPVLGMIPVLIFLAVLNGLIAVIIPFRAAHETRTATG